jgi:hypothetical protein
LGRCILRLAHDGSGRGEREGSQKQGHGSCIHAVSPVILVSFGKHAEARAKKELWMAQVSVRELRYGP